METVKTLLDAVKHANGITSDYGLAKLLELPKQRVSAYYSGKEVPNEFICLQIARALGRDYAEVQAAVRIEAEKDDTRREAWREYFKSIAGYATSVFAAVGLTVILFVTAPGNACATSNAYDSAISENTNYALSEGRFCETSKLIVSL